MANYIKDPHAVIFTHHTGCRKSQLVLDLMGRNVTNAWLIEPKDKLYEWTVKLSLFLAHSEALYHR